MRTKYKMIIYFETEEEFQNVDEVLEGSPLLDTDFRGIVTSAKLIRRVK